MIPLLQFDPSSLSFWYDAHLIAKCRGSKTLGLAIDHAYFGRDEQLRSAIASAPDEWTATRAAHVASAVWHEKRHFIDFLLTNYGALRVRQFFEIYANMPTALAAAKEMGGVLVPLDSNLDPIKREMYGIVELDPRIKQIAEGIATRKKMLEQDRARLEVGGRRLETGGEAIFEAIAYHTQIGLLELKLGLQAGVAVQHDMPANSVIRDKYKWIYEVLAHQGLLEFREIDDTALVLNDKPLFPLLYAALAGRYYKQEQARGKDFSSYMPAERLASLLIDFGANPEPFHKMEVAEAWDAINRRCNRLFGRTVLQEMEQDIEHEAKYIELMSAHSSAEHAITAYQEYHTLRCKLFEEFKRHPEPFLTAGPPAGELLARARPKVVVAASGGEIGTPPPSFERLFGYAHPETDYEKVPQARWWWAATPAPPRKPNKHLIELREHSAWCQVISDYAPMAKLFASGMRMRLMLGPEVFNACTRISHHLQVRFIIDGFFLHARESHDISYWYYLTGKEQLRCELSHAEISKPEGIMLDAWEQRLRPKFLDALLDAVADTPSMRFTLWRDWSPWILSEEYASYFKSFRVDESLLRASFDERIADTIEHFS